MSRLKVYYKRGLLIPHSKNMRALWNSPKHGHREICMSGNRGCGKTIDLLLYAIDKMVSIPGFRVNWARSEYSTIATTVIETLEHDIFEYPMGDSRNKHPKNPFILRGGTERPKLLEWDNGSRMRFIGLDSKTKTRGMAADLNILNEGTREDTSAAWQEMGAVQAGGRARAWFVNGKPFSQKITDTNPDSPIHWIYKLFRKDTGTDELPDIGTYPMGEKLWLGFSTIDNPLHTDRNGKINELGIQKDADLVATYPEGFERLRMVFSQWCAAIGLVYSGYKPDVHEIDMGVEDFDAGSRWYMGLDLGGTDPFACVFVNVDQNGTQRIYKEIVKSQCLLEEVEADMYDVLSLIGESQQNLTIVSDTNVPEFIKRLRKNKWRVIEAEKGKGSIEDRVDLGKRTIGNNKLYINKNSLMSRDQKYGGPQGFKEEVLGYTYYPEEKQLFMKNPNVPVDKNDHSMNAWEYLNKYLTKPKASGNFLSVTGKVKAKHKGW